MPHDDGHDPSDNHDSAIYDHRTDVDVDHEDDDDTSTYDHRINDVDNDVDNDDAATTMRQPGDRGSGKLSDDHDHIGGDDNEPAMRRTLSDDDCNGTSTDNVDSPDNRTPDNNGTPGLSG